MQALGQQIIAPPSIFFFFFSATKAQTLTLNDEVHMHTQFKRTVICTVANIFMQALGQQIMDPSQQFFSAKKTQTLTVKG